MNTMLNSFGEILNCKTDRCIRNNLPTRLIIQTGLITFNENLFPKIGNDRHELDYLSKYDRCYSCINGKLKSTI